MLHKQYILIIINVDVFMKFFIFQSKVRIAARHRKNVSLFRTCVPLLFITLTFIMFSIMYWLYFDLREQLSDHRTKIQQGTTKQKLN